MLKNWRWIFCALPLTWAVFVGCSKTEQLQTGLIQDYYPLQIGKFITYKLDSTVYINLNTVKTVKSYIIQDWVDAEITDNLGRKSYRIRRMMRSTTDTSKWSNNATFVITPLSRSLEFVENNLRYIKLQEPIRNDFTWKGNSYINTIDLDLQYLEDWDYFYENAGEPFSIGGKSFPEAVIVQQRDEVINNPNDPTTVYSVNTSKEVYSKGIGLVFKEFLHETWQPPNATSPTGFFEPNSYGVKLTYLNHN